MKKLEKQLNLSDVISISLSAMLGSGVFVLPGLVFPHTGSSIWLAYLFAAFCVIPAALSQSELSTAMPSSGGTYRHLQTTFGPLVGSVSGLGLFLSLTLKSSFSLVGFAAYLHVLAHIPIKITALILLIFIVFFNILGISKITKIITAIVYTTLLILLILFLGPSEPSIIQKSSFLKEGLGGFIYASALIFLSYSGVLKIAAIGEEVKNPERNLYLSTVISLGIISLVYCAVSFSLVSHLPENVLNMNLHPLYDLAKTSISPSFAILICIVGIIMMTAMANAGLLAASRFPLAMSADKLLPSFLNLLHQKYLTPINSILLTGTIMALIILFLDIEKIVKLASSFFILIYIFINLTVIVLRETRVQWYRPTYKSPLYPFLHYFGIITGLIFLFSLGFAPLASCILTILAGLIVYQLYGKKRSSFSGLLKIYGKREDIKEDTHSIKQTHLHQIDSFDTSGKFPTVVALFKKQDNTAKDNLVELGVALSKIVSSEDPKLKVLHLTEVPEQLDLNELSIEPYEVTSLERRIKMISEKNSLPVYFDPLVSYDIYKSLNQVISFTQTEWLITEYRGKKRDSIITEGPLGWLKDYLPCKMIFFKDAGIRYFRKILFIYDPEDKNELYIRLSCELSTYYGGEVELGVLSDKDKDHSYHKEALKIAEKFKIKTVLIKGDLSQRASMIAKASANYDLLILSKKNKKTILDFFRNEDDEISEKSPCSIVFIYLGKKINEKLHS